MTQWKLVPVEPTHNMILAGSLDSRMTPDMADSSYRAMLNAAPRPDVQPVAWRVHPFDYGIGVDGAYAITQLAEQRDVWIRKGWNVAPLYTHPPAAADVQPAIYPEEAREMGLEEVPYYTHPPVEDVRPVAYETENELWWHDAPDINDHIRKTGIPLYRHPPAAAVQDLVAALMIIAGKQRCVDSLMSNVDIALEALKKWEGK